MHVCMFACCMYAFADGSRAPEALSLIGANCCGVDAPLLWNPVGILLPPFHPALQKQQVQ